MFKNLSLLSVILGLLSCSSPNSEWHYSSQAHFEVSCGKLLSIDSLNSAFISKRNVEIWLPPDFNENLKYPVLYMHDGQMLFDSLSTWNHQEWGVDEVLCSLFESHTIPPCIVVGIWNSGSNRQSEYFPQKVFESYSSDMQDSLYQFTNKTYGQKYLPTKVNSDNYLKFLVQELKPLIDRHLPTLTDSENTYILGSSMGGLISWYAGLEYPEVFGKIGCLSTHWVGIIPIDNNPIPSTFVSYMAQNIPEANNSKWYFDYGTETLDSNYQKHQLRIDSILLAKSYTFKNWMSYKAEGAKHTERAWNARLFIPLSYLMTE